ncbi:MAG: glycosyltransferase family 4 protein [Colwelliaceae bacterium]|nr:glycosyltransferase family 4 protein [Colwelliaceae bacterium]
MKQNIIFINALSAKLGGGRTYLINLLSYLSDSDVSVYVACPDKSMLPESNKLNYVETPFANNNILFRAFWELFVLPKMLLKLNVDTLFVPGGMDFTLQNKRFKKVTMFRNMLPFDKVALLSLGLRTAAIKNIVLRKLMIRTMNSADHVIFISEYARSSIRGLLNLNDESVIYHGIAKNFSPVKVKSNNFIYNDSILYVSRFEPYKNHLNLIKAYQLLSDEHKQKHSLLLVGEGMEPSLSLCKEFIDSNNLEENVKIIGKVEYELLPELYQQCQLFVFPSSCENCPNILLEAIGCGAPVVAAQTSPMPEFGKNAALYFNEEDVQSIFGIIKEVLESTELRNRMIAKSTVLRDEYAWEKTADLTWKCLIKTGKNNV